MSSTKILIVDDEEDILELLEYNLEKEGYAVIKAFDGEEALQTITREKPDLIILDIMMPKMDGIETCRQIRNIPGMENVYIIFLTARSEEYSELAGFEAGADDYISKPIKPKVLMSRIKAIMRRTGKSDVEESLKIHDLEIIPDEYLVKKGGNPIALPKKEFDLLYFLASKPGKVFKRAKLLEKVWGNVFVVDRTIDVHVRKLREKVGENYIITVKGVGYKFLGE